MEKLKIRDLVKTADGNFVVVDTSTIGENRGFYETMVFESDVDGYISDFAHALYVEQSESKETIIEAHNKQVETWKHENLDEALCNLKMFEYTGEIRTYLKYIQDLCNEGKISLEEAVKLINDDDDYGTYEDRKLYVLYKPE